MCISFMMVFNQRKSIVVFFWLVVAIRVAYPQQSSPMLTFSPSYGFVIPHYKHMQHYLTSHAVFAEIAFEQSVLPRGESLRERPLAVCFHVLSPGNPEVFGYGLGLVSKMKFPLNKSHSLSFNLGTGIGYLTKSFSVENYRNIYIGSHFNAVIEFGLESILFRTTGSLWTGRVQWVHYSNGGTKMPNKGINIPMFGITAKIPVLKTPSPDGASIRQPIPFVPSSSWLFSFSGSTRQVLTMGARFGVVNFGIDKYFHKHRNYQFGAGMEFIADASARAKKTLAENTENFRLPGFKIACHASWMAYIDRIGVQLTLGSYFRNANFREENLYERLALKYFVNKNWVLSVSLKSHLTTADVIEYGLNYIIP